MLSNILLKPGEDVDVIYTLTSKKHLIVYHTLRLSSKLEAYNITVWEIKD